MINPLINISTVAILTFGQLLTPVIPATVVASHEISLQNRYAVSSVSEVFKDNILLNLAYMNGTVNSKEDINWDQINQPFHYEMTLNPGEVFAYHDDILDIYKGKMGKTSRSHFNAADGYKTDGYLYGDGVCHLASLIYWVARDAGLETLAPTNHDFMEIPEIAREYGVSIYSNPGGNSDASQNLYVVNNKNKTIAFMFDYDGSKLKISVAEAN